MSLTCQPPGTWTAVTSHDAVVGVGAVPLAVVCTVMATMNVIDACVPLPNEAIRVIVPELLDTRCCWDRCCAAPGGSNCASSVCPSVEVTSEDSRCAYVA